MLVNASKKSQKVEKSHKNKFIVFLRKIFWNFSYYHLKDSKWIVKLFKKVQYFFIEYFVTIIHVINSIILVIYLHLKIK